MLKKQRQKHNFTHEQLGEHAQIDGNTISRYERGIQTPSAITLIKLLTILNINVHDYPAVIKTAFDPDKE